MEKRIDKIKQKLESEGKVSVTDLSELYNVTEETIRRDLEKLKNEGFVTRTFGGAVLNTSLNREHIHFFKRRSINNDSKKKIAELSVGYCNQFRTIMADSSTTVMETLKKLENNSEITVITFSAQIFQELNGTKMKIISTGGIYDADTLSFKGVLAKESISKYNVDIAFLSCKGLDINMGIMDSTESEAVLKTEMAKRAKKVALLVDHSKFNQSAFVNFLDWEDVDYIITDKYPSDEWVEFCKEKNIQLVY